MRALHDPEFAQFLLRIGNGTEPLSVDNLITLPQDMMIPWESEDSLQHLISTVFPDISMNAENADYMFNRALLTTTNDYVDQINDMVLSHYLNSITPGNLPPHRLDLKKGCPIILTRNINPTDGLCNGTRLICRHFYPNLIQADIITGSYKGKTAFLHRIPLKSTADMKLPFALTRKQFPIRLSFALTIHRSQGQTIPFVGIYLPHNVFAHGQLYVALSRGKSRENTKVMINNSHNTQHLTGCTENVVYTDILF
ncbi:DNA helicase [Ranunculus cassubicifolius]